MTVASYLKDKIASSGKTQRQIALEVGYSKPNVVSMMSNGQTKIPINKIPLFSRALGVDPAHMLRLALAEYHPEIWDVIDATIGRPLTENETRLLGIYREATYGGVEAPLDKHVLEAVRAALKPGERLS